MTWNLRLGTSRLLHDLKQPGRAHAAADAHRDDDLFGAAPLAFDERVADEPLAGHPVWMSDGNRAAVDVQSIVGDAQAVATVDHLDGERFVQLPQIDVLDLRAGLLEQLRHGE